MKEKELPENVIKLKQLFERRKATDARYSFGDLAAALGYARKATLISMLFSGNYKMVPRLEQAIVNELSRDQESRALSADFGEERFPVFVETSVYKKFYEAARMCHLRGQIGRATGPSGIGKSTSVQHYKKSDETVILVRAHLRYSTKEVFSDICLAVGIEAKGTVHKMMMALVERLNGSRRLLIIDEAEHLGASTLDEIRQLNDRAGIGVLYVGTDRFKSRLQTLRGDYEYIVNRVKVPASLKKLTLEDAGALCRSVIPGLKDEQIRIYHTVAGGDARLLENLVFKSLLVSQRNAVTPDMKEFVDVINSTADMLLERSAA